MSSFATSTGLAGLFLAMILFLPPQSARGGSADAPLQTVGEVDLDRYAGTWHEIARLPNRFQDHCMAEVTAQYGLREDGRIDVLNRCRTADGEFDEANGVARVVDPASRAKRVGHTANSVTLRATVRVRIEARFAGNGCSLAKKRNKESCSHSGSRRAAA